MGEGGDDIRLISGSRAHFQIWYSIQKEQENKRKIRKNWRMVVMMLGCFQGPGSISKYGNLSNNGQKITEKSGKIGG